MGVRETGTTLIHVSTVVGTLYNVRIGYGIVKHDEYMNGRYGSMGIDCIRLLPL